MELDTMRSADSAPNVPGTSTQGLYHGAFSGRSTPFLRAEDAHEALGRQLAERAARVARRLRADERAAWRADALVATRYEGVRALGLETHAAPPALLDAPQLARARGAARGTTRSRSSRRPTTPRRGRGGCGGGGGRGRRGRRGFKEGVGGGLHAAARGAQSPPQLR
eukprot:scaffold61190_cov71-Phaeocystis_antarctica.AAC.1